MVANVSATFGQRPYKRSWRLTKIGSDIMPKTMKRGGKKKKKTRGGRKSR